MSDPKKNLMFYGLILATVSVAALLSAYVSAGSPAPAAPSLGRARSFAVLGGSTVTNTGATKITGDVGVSSPGVSVTGFPPGTIARGAQHVGDPAANEAQRDAQTAYAALAVGGAATLGTGTAFTGSILAYSNITMNTGASLSGRALARAAVTMDSNRISVPQ